MTAKTIHLKPETWRLAKQAALDSARTLRDIVDEAVREWVARNGGTK